MPPGLISIAINALFVASCLAAIPQCIPSLKGRAYTRAAIPTNQFIAMTATPTSIAALQVDVKISIISPYIKGISQFIRIFDGTKNVPFQQSIALGSITQLQQFFYRIAADHQGNLYLYDQTKIARFSYNPTTSKYTPTKAYQTPVHLTLLGCYPGRTNQTNDLIFSSAGDAMFLTGSCGTKIWVQEFIPSTGLSPKSIPVGFTIDASALFSPYKTTGAIGSMDVQLFGKGFLIGATLTTKAGPSALCYVNSTFPYALVNKQWKLQLKYCIAVTTKTTGSYFPAGYKSSKFVAMLGGGLVAFVQPQNIVLLSVSTTSASIITSTPLFRSSAFPTTVEIVGNKSTDTMMFPRMMSHTLTRSTCSNSTCSLFVMETAPLLTGRNFTLVRYDVDTTKKTITFMGAIPTQNEAGMTFEMAGSTAVVLDLNFTTSVAALASAGTKIMGFDTTLQAAASCADCAVGFYGKTCASACSSKCNARAACVDGPTGTGQCYCAGPTFGSQCLACGCNTANGKCDSGLKGTGVCLSCNTGFFGRNCSKPCTCQEMNGLCDFNVTGSGTCLNCYSKCKAGPTCTDVAKTCQKSWLQKNSWIFGVIIAVLAIMFGGCWAHLHPQQTHSMLNIDSDSLVQQ